MSELVLRYNLQFFAEGEGGEKTEQATDKKLREARNKGQVAKSKEVGNAAELIALFLLLKFYGQMMGGRFVSIFEWVYEKLIPDYTSLYRSGMSPQAASSLLTQVFGQMGLVIFPFFLAGVGIAILSNVAQIGFKVTPETMKPSFNKLNPASGVKRLFSKQQLFELGKSILKVFVILYIAYSCIKDHLAELLVLYELSLNGALSLVFSIVVDTGLRISLVYIVVAVADFVYQKLHFKNEMKMTKQEVKDEYKNSEGDPQIKGQQKRRMQEASRRRMMQSVPQADVVITNPTHLAVAIKYDQDHHSAPTVLAKGADYLAQRIKDAAKDHHIDIVENKPLARALYTTVDVGEEIPPELYEAVAEILAMVYKKKGNF